MPDEEYDFGLDGAGRKKLNKAKENEKKAKQSEKAEADAKRKSEASSLPNTISFDRWFLLPASSGMR